MHKPNAHSADSTTAASNYLRQKAAEPITLLIDGRYELPVRDAVSRAKLRELVDRLEAIVGIQQGLDDVEAGRISTLEEVRTRAAREDV
jgi:hypothetical protein